MAYIALEQIPSNNNGSTKQNALHSFSSNILSTHIPSVQRLQISFPHQQRHSTTLALLVLTTLVLFVSL